MKNSLSRIFRSVVESFRSARRIPKEPPISPAEFQKMLAQTLADPDFKLMLLKSMAGTVWPIEGGNSHGMKGIGSLAGGMIRVSVDSPCPAFTGSKSATGCFSLR